MQRGICTVQEGSIDPSEYAALAAALTAALQDSVGTAARPALVWCEVPRGQAFTAGAPSSVSLVMIEVADRLDSSTRSAALRSMSDAWCDTAGVQPDQLMLTLADSSEFSNYLRLMQQRIRPTHRPAYLARTGATLAASRLRRGHFSAPANY
jgi:hypothetical protein